MGWGGVTCETLKSIPERIFEWGGVMFKILKSVLERIIRLHGKLMENVCLRVKRCQKLNPNKWFYILHVVFK